MNTIKILIDMLKTYRFSIHIYTQATLNSLGYKNKKKTWYWEGDMLGRRSRGSWKWEMTGEYDCHALYAWMKFSKEEWRKGRERRSYLTVTKSFYITHTNLVLFTIYLETLSSSTYKCTRMLSILSLKSVSVTSGFLFCSVSIISNTVWFYSFSWKFLGHWHPLPWNCKAHQKMASLKRGAACFLCGNLAQDWTCRVHKRKCKQLFAQLIGS